MNLSATSKLELRRNIELARFTTMRIGGEARYFAEPTNESEICELLKWSKEKKVSYVILGKGSNVIFDSSGFDGLVISMAKYKKDWIKINSEESRVNVSAGISLNELTEVSQKSGLAGTEFLAGIPGSVGGAVLMNAGFSRHYGQRNEIGDLIERVTVLDKEGNLIDLKKDKLMFSYRKSNLSNYIILEVELSLWKRSLDKIEEEIKLNLEWRGERQSVGYPSSGSIFRNPPLPKPSAAKLIDDLGLKGKKVEDIKISEEHSNFFVNTGNATSEDLEQLIREVQKAVFDATGIILKTEIKIIKKN